MIGTDCMDENEIHRQHTQNQVAFIEIIILTYIRFISWRSALLVEDARVPGENNRPAASHWQTLSHNVLLKSNNYPLLYTVIIIT
jgi:hypothetical protein